MKFTIDYSSLGKASEISQFIQKSSNDILLDTFCLGYKQRKIMEISEINNIITNVISQQYTTTEKVTRENFAEQKNNIDRQLADLKTVSSAQHEVINSRMKNINLQISQLPKENNDKELPAVLKTILDKIDKLDDPNIEISARMDFLNKTIETKYGNIINKRFDELRDNMMLDMKQERPYEKGLRGEILVRQKLLNYFTDAEVNDVSSKGYQGDIIFSRPANKYNKQILIEVKNYGDRNVPTKEVDKFHRDMKNYTAGIIISLNSGIVGYKEMTEEIKDNKILIYIPKADESCLSLYYSIILIDALSKYEYEQKINHERDFKSNKLDVDPQIFNNIIKALTPIKKTVEHYDGLLRTLKSFGNKINNDVETLVEDAQKVIEGNKKVVQDTIDSIIVGCQNRESPKDVQPYESITDMVIYKELEEEVKTNMGIFVIRMRACDAILYEKSTLRQIIRPRHTKTKKSKLSALTTCKKAIAEIEKHGIYKPKARKTKKDGKVVPMAPPSFIPDITLKKEKEKEGGEGKEKDVADKSILK